MNEKHANNYRDLGFPVVQTPKGPPARRKIRRFGLGDKARAAGAVRSFKSLDLMCQ